jgi:hypothetical protein
MSWDKSQFSKKEWDLIKRYYLAQREGLKGKYKVKKAQLYREVYEKPNLSGNSACCGAKMIFRRFEALPKDEQQKILDKMELEAREEKLLKIETATNIVMAKAEVMQDNIKGYKEGRIEGQKAGIQKVKEELKQIDFTTYRGRVREKELLYLELKNMLHVEENKTPIIRGLVELLAEPKNEVQSQIKIENSINEITPEVALKVLNDAGGISYKTLEALLLKMAGKEEDILKGINSL